MQQRLIYIQHTQGKIGPGNLTTMTMIWSRYPRANRNLTSSWQTVTDSQIRVHILSFILDQQSDNHKRLAMFGLYIL
jgi:hypothetical protein